jgi:molybdenum cofactor synthesis domain-containing protein
LTVSSKDLSAGILVIGNEVLSAKVADENGPFLLGRLRSMGVEVPRVLVVGDTIDEIVWGVQTLRTRCDWVFTTGGVGPTHDDVTVAGVAAALGRRVVRASALEALVREYLGTEPPPAAFRMADVVEGSELVSSDASRLPALVVDRIVLLPGVPALMRRQFEVVAPRLQSRPFLLRQVYLDASEPEIASALDRVALIHPRVAIGSYPTFERDADYRVKLTIEGRDSGAVEAAYQDVVDAMPKGSILRAL